MTNVTETPLEMPANSTRDGPAKILQEGAGEMLGKSIEA